MPLSGLLTRIVTVRRTGYPEGVSPNHYIPLLTRRRLSGDEVLAITGSPVTDPLGLLG